MAKKNNLDLDKRIDVRKGIYNFKAKKNQYVIDSIRCGVLGLKKQVNAMGDYLSEMELQSFRDLVNDLEMRYKNIPNAIEIVDKISEIASEVKIPEVISKKSFKIKNLPADIKDDVDADLEEVNRCFDAGCYRSCVMLCGRILESCLHRVYYEKTGKDLLEKSPGIGLGNIIGKLRDLDFRFDPGISQQIHLINQIRIFSVHKKQDVFYPSKEQAHAIILFTLDAVNKLLDERRN